MNPWTSPRAYIIRMTGAQTKQLYAASLARLQAKYDIFLAQLVEQYRKDPDE